MQNKINDFINFLAVEKENTIKMCANLGDDFFLFSNMDALFQKMLEIRVEPNKNIMIPSYLFLDIHREYYLGIGHFLRLHNTKSFLNLRSAIDNSFTAYYLFKNPEKLDVYAETTKGKDANEELMKEWKKIFLNIKRTMKENADVFALAKPLVDIHEFCSIHAHADALSIATRFANSAGYTFELNYFDYEKNTYDYKKWMGALLFGFFNTLTLFWKEFFASRAGDKYQEIIKRLNAYEKKLIEFMKQYRFKPNT